LLRLEQTQDERWWMAFGAVTGFSLNTKYMIAFYLVALAIALLFTPRRSSLLRPWIYFGALLAGVMVLPNVLWQQAHGWPFIELGKNASTSKNIALSPAAFLLQQVIFVGPLAAAVWLSGLWAGMVHPKFAVARAYAIAWLILFGVFVISHGKPYYLSAIYPTLLALGAVRIEAWIDNKIVRFIALAGITVQGILTMPMALPILPVTTFIRYEKFVGFMPSSGERLKLGILPQYYADMFGWREMAKKIAAVYWSLPPRDRSHAAFYGNNYGEAAAIDVFGAQLGLPPAISGHNNYYIWGPRGNDGSVLIIIGGNPKHYADLFNSFEVVGRVDAPFAMPYETDKPIYVLRNMKTPLQDYWPNVRSFQ
jgi:Dolichyl-phosphate-mannose-protein mannosyltransferase